MTEVQQSEVGHHGIERRVAEPQRLGVALVEVHRRVSLTRQRDHLAGHIDADGDGAAFCTSYRHEPRAAADVEQPLSSCADLDRVEQRLDQPAGDTAEEPLVAPWALVLRWLPRRR